MSTTMIILGIVFTLIFGYVWLLIHEFSHLLAASSFVKIKDWSIKPYPHWNDGLRFASIRWTYEGEVDESDTALILLAPRIPDFIALVLIHLVFFLPFPPFWAMLWAIFWGCGVMDLIIGSVGIDKNSDLRRAAEGLKMNSWWLRIIGLTMVVPLIILTVVFLV